MKKIAPSILSADFSCLGEQIIKVVEGGADYIHVDVMDGRFVPNITIGPVVIRSIRKICPIPLDVHLMIEEPHRFVAEFAKAGSDILSVHEEACPHLSRTISLIKEYGIKAGAALNPSTPLTNLWDILPELDRVIIMSVNPGFAGQTFMESVLDKIKELDEMRKREGLHLEITVDGGIKLSNIGKVSRAGADAFVAGSAVFGEENLAEAVRVLREASEGK